MSEQGAAKKATVTLPIVEELDARTGGAWRFLARNPDGSEIVLRGYFCEVTPPERIVQRFEWDATRGSTSCWRGRRRSRRPPRAARARPAARSRAPGSVGAGGRG